MVVTRRTPVVPASPAGPPTSQTRAAKGKAVDRTGSTVSSDTLANGETRVASQSTDMSDRSGPDGSLRKGKGKSKQKKGDKKRRKRSSGLIDTLVQGLILSLIIYTLSVCPSDERLESPVCRGISYYRKYVLDPYVVEPLQASLAHPAVAPYVQRVQPYADKVVVIATPVMRRTRAEWNSRVVPQWNKRVVPQWRKRVVPQWKKYAVPQIQRVEKELEPYGLRAQREYDQRIEPLLKTAQFNVLKWQRQASPYVSLAVAKTRDGYETAKPYAIPAWNRFKALVTQLLIAARDQRRLYVDPHVARMWEKIMELSSGKPKASTTSSSMPVKPLDDKVPSPSAASVSETTDTASTGKAATQSLSSSASSPSTSVETNSVIASTKSPTASSKVVSSSSSSSASPIPPSSAAAPPADIPDSSSSSSASPSPSSSSVEQSLRVTGPSATPPAPTTADDDEEIDVNDFYAELGLEPPAEVLEAAASAASSASAPESQTSVQSESEEERAERIRRKQLETAEKRQDIERRHTEWEIKIEDVVKAKKKELRKNLVAMRKAAAADLRTHKDVRGQIEGLVSEGEKFLKGAEKFFKSLKGESRKNDEKLKLWDRVVDQVGVKFEGRLKEVEVAVNGWYKTYITREHQEVKNRVDDVRDISDAAQANLGMDYAWLDGVTAKDWTRYHDLIRRSEAFTDQAGAIQNGTHPSPPINPVLKVVDELENEVQDIVVGFETRLRRIKRSGERAFGAQVRDDEDAENAADPEFSILPVEPTDGKDAAPGVPPVVIGRGKEEVLEALGKVETASAKETSAPAAESKKEPEAVVQSIVEEAKVEAKDPEYVSHVEL